LHWDSTRNHKLHTQSDRQPCMVEAYRSIASYLNGGCAVPSCLDSKVTNCDSSGAHSNLLSIPTWEGSVGEIDSLYGSLSELLGCRKANRYVTDIIVHGSFGDGRLTHFSDVDLTVVLDNGVFEKQESITELRAWVLSELCGRILKVDPLQHHGPFYLWPDLMRSYSENILPIDAYRKSWSVNHTTLDFLTEPNADEGKKPKAVMTMQALLDAESHFFSEGYHMYAVKRMLSNLMLVPAMLSQDLGKPISKAESFKWFYSVMGDSAEAVRRATVMRANWPATPGWVNRCTQVFHYLRPNKPIPAKMVRKLYVSKATVDAIKKEIFPELPKMHRKIESVLCE